MTEEANTSGDQPRETGQPSSEDIRKYLEQLRPVPADQVLAETLSSTLTAAQAKLGRYDARLLIDTAGLIFTHARGYLNDEAAKQFEQVLNQLRMAQVQAEQRSAGQQEENDLPQPPAPPAGSGVPQAPAAAPPRQQASPASKLWVPGRP
ncbi:hypothetical protein [Phytoactinopolyspora endophytica]|uniref:hypothetical protein n=1 Tax=Phytoactinopolyspora endophytica TaxID=1642495 RepID=UPI00101CC182|nr:hypothetical protein [Phytoactinopolyspora endophytica]